MNVATPEMSGKYGDGTMRSAREKIDDLSKALLEIDAECQGGSESWQEYLVLRKIRSIIARATSNPGGKS